MPWDAVICRRKLDESMGLTWICQCPICQRRRKDGNEPVSNSEGSGRVSEAQTTGCLQNGQSKEDTL